MSLFASARQRLAHAALVATLVFGAVLGVAAIAAANTPEVLPVEPDGGIGD